MMLRTATSELRERLPEIVPVIDPSYGHFEQRAAMGLRQTLPKRTHVGSPRFSWHFRHQKLLASLPGSSAFRIFGGGKAADYGCITLSEIQGFIDIAGFAYTSQWGDKPTQDLAQLTAYFNKQQNPVILLPQAFGPFETPEIRSAMREVIGNASLIFARDEESYKHLQGLAPASDSIRQSPDITLFYPREPASKLKEKSGSVGIVPNARMLDQGKNLWGSNYYDVLLAIISYLRQSGTPAEILVHDASGQDMALAEEIRERAGSPYLPIFSASDPFIIKQRISEYHLIIGSRYHSLVAALSTTVPAIALGWAHKYKLLMEDFGLNRYLLLPDISTEDAVGIVEELAQEDVNETCRKQIGSRLAHMSAANQEMWQSVTDVLTAS